MVMVSNGYQDFTRFNRRTAMATVCKKVKIGSKRGVPEFKVEWEGRPIPRPVTYTRRSEITAYAEVCGPRETVESAWTEIKDCAAVGAGAAGLAAIFTSGSAALPAFKAAFMACLRGKIASRATRVRVGLSVKQQSGRWSKV